MPCHPRYPLGSGITVCYQWLHTYQQLHPPNLSSFFPNKRPLSICEIIEGHSNILSKFLVASRQWMLFLPLSFFASWLAWKSNSCSYISNSLFHLFVFWWDQFSTLTSRRYLLLLAFGFSPLLALLLSIFQRGPQLHLQTHEGEVPVACSVSSCISSPSKGI